eukprot:1155393-Pelagomonas_calceolata.AAC.2
MHKRVWKRVCVCACAPAYACLCALLQEQMHVSTNAGCEQCVARGERSCSTPSRNHVLIWQLRCIGHQYMAASTHARRTERAPMPKAALYECTGTHP